MDNLAHGMLAIVVGSQFDPKQFRERTISFGLINALIANLPDLDIVLGFWGREVYHYHHRGLTHSMFGFILFLPLIYLMVRKTIGSLWTQKKCMIYVCVQIGFTHYFLDYLTQYGVMFLYPLSFDRFSYPLMFIVDPFFWMIELGLLVYLTLCLKKPLSKKSISVRIFRLSPLVFFFYWSFLFGMQQYSLNILNTVVLQPALNEEAQKYKRNILMSPGMLSPFFWHSLESYEADGARYYRQSFTSPIADKAGKIIGDGQFILGDRFCSSFNYPESAMQAFERYQKWAEYTYCEDHINQKTQEPMCRCYALKYSFPQLSWAPFGTLEVGRDGVGLLDQSEHTEGGFDFIFKKVYDSLFSYEQ